MGGIASCLPEMAPAKTCPPPGPGWMRKHPMGDLAPLPDQILLRSDGKILWNGAAVSLSGLGRFVKAARRLNPRPVIIFTPSPLAPCGQIEQIRHLLDAEYLCGAEGRCGEGRKSDWYGARYRR